MSKDYSRREFIKKNSLAGLGLAITAGLPGIILDARAESSSAVQNEPSMFFDGFTQIGPKKYKHPSEQWSLKHLLTELDHCSISGALVSYTQSIVYDPMFSNLELSGMLKPYPHLFAIWNAMPAASGEFPEPEALGKKMEEHNVRAISLHAKTNAWDWRAPESEPLLKWLNKNRILTITPVTELDYEDLEEFLTKYPNLPLLLTGAYWSAQRIVLPLIKRHKNLHISFEKFQINYGIEHLVKEGCADQLIFASNAPTMSAGAHRTYIDYAQIPKEARDKAAGGNLVRLLKGQKPPRVHVNKNEDILMTAVRQGLPLPAAVLDMHMHILHEGLDGAGGAYRMEDGGPKGTFALINRLGYKGGGFMSWSGVVSQNIKGGNIATKLALDAAPKGYWGLGNFDPTHYSQEELAVMIPELYKDKRFIGMKPYHQFGVRFDDPSYDIWWKYGNDNHFYALLHSSRSDSVEVETLAKKYPNVRWVLAHAGANYKVADTVIGAIKKYPNIYAEITLTPVTLGVVEYLVKGAGEDRIMYGSDLPMRDPRQQLGWVVFSHLPLSVKKKVLAENAMNVIRPCLDRLPAHNRPAL